jgi:hypothetical protein
VDRLTGGRVEHINRATVLGHQFAIDQMRITLMEAPEKLSTGAPMARPLYL